MLTMEIILCLAAIGNGAWSIFNWRNHQGHLKLFRLMEVSAETKKAEADTLLRKAKQIATAATMHLEYKVCSVCQRIVVQHDLDDNGVVRCVNCATDLARKAS
jgi:hypothetical protein